MPQLMGFLPKWLSLQWHHLGVIWSKVPSSISPEITFSKTAFQHHHCEGPLATSLALPHLSTHFLPILSPSSQVYSKAAGFQLAKDNLNLCTFACISPCPTIYFIMLQHPRSERKPIQKDWHMLESFKSSHDFFFFRTKENKWGYELKLLFCIALLCCIISILLHGQQAHLKLHKKKKTSWLNHPFGHSTRR